MSLSEAFVSNAEGSGFRSSIFCVSTNESNFNFKNKLVGTRRRYRQTVAIGVEMGMLIAMIVWVLLLSCLLGWSTVLAIARGGTR